MNNATAIIQPVVNDRVNQGSSIDRRSSMFVGAASGLTSDTASDAIDNASRTSSSDAALHDAARLAKQLPLVFLVRTKCDLPSLPLDEEVGARELLI